MISWRSLCVLFNESQQKLQNSLWLCGRSGRCINVCTIVMVTVNTLPLDVADKPLSWSSVVREAGQRGAMVVASSTSS